MVKIHNAALPVDRTFVIQGVRCPSHQNPYSDGLVAGIKNRPIVNSHDDKEWLSSIHLHYTL